MSEQVALAPVAADALSEDRAIEFNVARVQQQMRTWRELKNVLDAELADACVEIAGNLHRTRPFWSGVSVAGNIQVRIQSERREVFNRFDDGRENFGYLFVLVAVASTGREMPGDGSCFAIEKAPSFKCPHQNDAKRPGWSDHYPPENCPDFDPAFEWRTLPSQASEHNVRSHAFTRAFNRAIANLVGFGEVSAEEVQRPSDDDRRGSSSAAPRRSSAPSNPNPSRGPIPISESQAKRLWTIARQAGWTETEVKSLVGMRGFEHTADITRDKYDAIIEALEAGVDGTREAKR